MTEVTHLQEAKASLLALCQMLDDAKVMLSPEVRKHWKRLQNAPQSKTLKCIASLASALDKSVNVQDVESATI